MNLNDNAGQMVGIFNIQSIDAKTGEVLGEYHEKNLIMDKARQNMAKLVGAVTDEENGAIGLPITRFVLGTKGHVGDNILSPIKVGEGDFDSTRSELFSQENGALNYMLDFDASGAITVDVDGTGTVYMGNELQKDSATKCKVKRVVAGDYGRTLTYTFEIPPEAANGDGVVAYTEAALFVANSKISSIFSMKTFPARVKEDSVLFRITWSIIF